MKSWCLHTVFVPADHTGDHAEVLKSTLEMWELEEKRQVTLTTDNGTNVVKAAKDLKWQQLSCFGNNLNLAVTSAIKNDDRLTQALGHSRKIVRAFSTSWKKRRDMKKFQLENLPQHNYAYCCKCIIYMYYIFYYVLKYYTIGLSD